MFQFMRYIISGGTAFVVDFGSFYLIHKIFGWWYVLAQVISYSLGFATTFLGHKYFVFQKKNDTAKHLGRYCLLELANFFIATGMLLIMIEWLQIPAEFAKIISMASVIMWNFFLYKFFVYV